jgi:hypothetical protein
VTRNGFAQVLLLRRRFIDGHIPNPPRIKPE